MVWLLCLVGGSAFAACPERSLSIAGVTEVAGRETALSISLVGTGNENGLSFSLSFDPARLTYLGQTFGAGAAGTSLFVNTNQVSLGELGLMVAKPAGQSFAAGSNELARISFLLSSSSATTTVSFADAPLGREVVDAYANVLCANYSNAQVVITPLFPPTILKDPVSQTVQPITNIATNVTFSVTAGGSPPLRFQWRWNGTNLGGASGTSLTLTNVGPAQAGNYNVVVTNDGGAVTSQVAVLTLLPALVPPAILSNPRSQLVSTGETVYLTVAASGSPPMNYQWQRNNSNLDQATNALLVLTNIAVAQAGSYRAVVSNSVGSATSQSATLTVSTTLRVVRIVSSAVATAGTVEVPVELVGFGDESAVGFSLNIDPGALSFLGVRLGAGAGGAGLLLNTNSLGAGSIGVALTLQAGQTFASGTNQLVLVRFMAGNISGPTTLAFGDQPIAREVADVLANPRPVRFRDGVVNVLATAPSITQDPQNLTVPIFSQAVFQAGVAGSAPLSYQWQWNGAALAGATGSALTLDNVTPSMGGGYRLIVTNAAGSATSAVAALTVPRVVRAGTTNGPTGNLVEMPIELLAAGDENAVGFSLDFDPAQMTAAGVAPGGALHGAALNFNTNQPGHVGVVVAQPNNAVFGFGTQEVARIQFLLGQQRGTNVPAWSDVPITRDLADTNANSQTVQFLPGSVGIQLVPPLVTGPPAAQTVWIGDTVTFDVSVSGSKPMSWQWQKNGADLPGATNAALTIANVQSGDSGNYSVRINNAAGSVSSGSALLTVLTARPDLFVSEVAAPTTAAPGQTVLVTWKLFNSGNADAPAGWWHTLWLASDAAGDNPQFVAALPFTTPLSAGQSLSVTGLVAVPSAVLGDRYFMVRADGSNDVAELNENNNAAVAAQSTHITSGDLALAALSAPANAQVGQTITVTWAVTNVGNTAADGPWQDRLYLGSSPDSLVGALTLLTVQAPVPTLAAGAAYTNTQQVALPANAQVSPGTYYLTALADCLNNVIELTRTNNSLTVPILLTADYIISASNNPPVGGTVAGTGYYVSGATNVLTAYPTPGYSFVNWTEGGDIVGTSPTLTTVVYGDHLFVANYAEANVIHVVITATSPAGVATVTGAGVYTNGQNATFSAPPVVVSGQYDYFFQKFVLTNTLVSTNASFVKTFSPADPTNLQYTAVYASLGVTPLVTNVTANLPNPVMATANFQLAFRFDRAMDTNFTPQVLLTNSALGAVQAVVPAGGHWASAVLTNDTFYPPPITLTSGMDGSIQVWLTGAQDPLGVTTGLTNVYAILLDATPPVLSTIAVSPAALSAFVTWNSDEPASSLVEYGASVTYGLNSGWYGQLVTSHGVTLYNLTPLTIYHYRVHSRDQAGNETVSGDNIFTTLAAPDLQVANLAASGTFVSGGAIVISWTDTNSGAGDTFTYWFDQIIVTNATTGETLLNTSVYFDPASGSIPSGGARNRQYNFTLPNGPAGAGDLQFIVTANAFNNQYEANAGGTAQLNNTATLEQTITLADYPDLQVAGLNATNSQLRSGGVVGIAWSDKNSGPGTVSSLFHDRIVVVNLDTAQTLVNTVLPYDASATPIPGAQSVDRQYSFTLPDGLAGVGSLRITITVDANNNVYEYSAGGTAESNNSASLDVASALADYPDLAVADLVVPATANANQPIQISWTETNSGPGAATNAWYDRVFLSSSNAVGGGQLLATFPFTNALAAGQSVTLTQSVALPQFSSGTQWLVVQANASKSFYELNYTNNSMVATQAVLISPTLQLTLNRSVVSESAGTNAVLATVVRNGSLDGALDVQLAPAISTNVIVPVSVTIPAGVSAANFYVSVLDNHVAGPGVVETISAKATGFAVAAAPLTILFDDPTTLVLAFSTNAVYESAGTGAITGTVTRSVNFGSALTITLSSDFPSALTVPASVTIPAGQASAGFAITPVPDNVVSDTRRARVTAAATDFSPASAYVDVLNVDMVQLKLLLAQPTVNKGAGSLAGFGTVTRSPVTTAAQTVRIEVQNSSIVTVPYTVSIPAGEASATFNVVVGNDNLFTGSQSATLAVTPLTPGGLTMPVGQTTAALEVLDINGPTLSLSTASSTISKGSNTFVTVTRNTLPTNAVTVTLSASPLDIVTLPATVDLPLNQSSATFTVTGVLDGVQTGPRQVTLGAAAAGFNSGAAPLTVSDIYLPDLVPVSIDMPTNGLTGAQVTVNWVVANNGLGNVTNQTWYDYVYLAADGVGGRSVLVGAVTNPLPPAVGASYTNQLRFYLPAVPGNYWVEVMTDGNNKVAELNEQNNALFSSGAIAVNPLYRAVVTNVTPAMATAGTPVVFSGYTYDPTDNHAVPNKSVALGVGVNETERYYSATSDANGAFSYTFQPLANEAGDYTVGADYPYVSQISTQASFVLLGMQAVPAGLRLQVLPNIPLTGQLVLSNLTGHALSGLNFAVPDLNGALTAQFTLTNNTLPASGTVTADYSLLSTLTRSAQVKFSATATSIEGARLTVPFQVSVVPLVAQLNADPGYLARGMVRGQQTVVSFDVVNSGGASSGDLTVRLPDLSWMTLGSAATIPSIPAGGKATVTLILNPPSDMTLALYPGTIAVANENTGLNMAYQFRAVSDATGDLQVAATDDYTYYVAGGPKVTNATVTLRDPFTSAVIAQTNTDANGIAYFTALPEGPYTLDAFADKHNPYRGSVSVVAGAVTDQEAFLPRQLVTYQWSVVPTEIQDEYKIVLESVFETEVPVPNVIIEEPRVLLLVAPGEVAQFDMKLRNVGLIAAENVTIAVPDDPDYLVTPLVETVGTIPAMSAVTVPVTVQLRSTAIAKAAAKAGGGVILPKGDGCSTSSLHACLPDIPLTVKYTVRCGANGKVESRTADLSVICTGKSVMDCLKDAKALAGSANMVSWACNTVSAFLSCVGPDLDPCTKMGIAAACGAVVGGVTGGWAGAGSGAASAGGAAMPECICSLLKNYTLPALPSSGGTGGGDVSYGAGLATGYFASGFPTVTGYIINNGNCADTPAPHSAATSTTTAPQSMGLASAPQFASLAAALRPKISGGVCARVRIRIEQSVVLTRTAFRGSLEIDNGGNSDISGIQVSLDFRDATNGPASDKFFTEGPVVAGMGSVDGRGVLAGGVTGSAVYTFIPTVDAAPDAPASYQIGGTLSYYDGGELVTVPLLSSQITVYPEARLDLTYFQQRDVYGDDPFTPQIEPSEPFALGLIVKNVGAGSAHNFQITSGQPQIVDNEKGLLINFTIIGTEVGGQPLTPSLSANLGDISPGGANEVTWEMLSTLQGKFISFDARFEHVNDLGSTETSLINSVSIHELIHPVLANRPTDDNAPDFLVNDIPDPDNLPDTLYLSDGTVAPVNVVTSGAFDGQVGPGHLQIHLTTTVSDGWNYFQLPDPGAGYFLQRVVRSDGKVLALTNNAWTTDRSFPSSSPGAVYENLLHLFDWAGTGAYTLYYHSTNTTPPAIVSVGPVIPFNQSGALSAVDIVFSEPVDTTTFSAANLALTLNGGANLIASGAAVSLTLLSNTTYSINGLAPFTAADGNYQLTVNGSGIYDLWANDAGNVSASTQWAKGNAAPVVQSITAVSPNPRNTPVASLAVNFSKAIAPATFNYQALSLTCDGSPNLITGDVTITAQSANSFIIGGLGPLTGAQGNYVLTVNAAAVQDTGGIAGAGSQSIAWSTITTGPTITRLEPISTNPRNIVVRTLDVTFSQPIDPTTFDYHAVTLSRDGGPNLVSSDVTVTRLTPTTFQVGNFSWVQGYAGTYSFTVNAAGVTDLAGNTGAGSTNETWQIILETPAAPAHLFITPDLGLSSTDGLTSTNNLTLFGTVGDTNLTVRVLDVTTGNDLGTAVVNVTNFSAALSFTSDGAHHLKVTATDVAGNVSLPSYFDLFIDVIPPTAIIQQVGSPLYSAVSSIPVVFAEPINTNTLSPTNFVVTLNGGSPFTPTLTYLSSNTCLLGNLAAYTAPLGTYQVAFNLGGVQDLAGNQSANLLTMSWVHGTTNLPPIIAVITNVVTPPDGTALVRVSAYDPNGDQLTYSLASGSLADAYIVATNGMFRWRPTRAYAETTNSFTVVVTDNGSPPMSATQTFTVIVLDFLEVSLGRTNLQGGESASLPVYLASNDGVTNVVFAVQVPEAVLTNWTLTALAPQLSSATLVDQTTNLVVTLQAAAGQSLQATQLVLQLSFLARANQPSGFVTLPVVSITGLKPAGSPYSNYVAHAGWVAVVQDQPLLLGAVSSELARTLTAYGKPGTNYQVQYKTTLTAPAWQPLFNYTQTNAAVNLELDGANPMIFYRLLQQ
jgi:hypothetical protein